MMCGLRSIVPAVVTLLSQIHPAAGQSIRGTVIVARTGQPLPFSVVMLSPGDARIFTDGQGRFSFPNLGNSTYVLSVRQIGFSPVDTQITLRGDDAPVVRIALHALVVQLPPLVVIGYGPCTAPGRPNFPDDSALVAVFDQLQENARRFELFADSYPFRFRLERTLRDVTRRGDTLKTVRELSIRSGEDTAYEVGRVVSPGSGQWNNELYVHTTILQDMVKSSFVENHCFHLVGRDTIESETLVRIDFEPATRLAWTDIAGAVYLDPITYELRFTETALTHPERSELRDVNTMTTRTRFHSIAPGIPLQDSLIAITTYRFGRFSKRIETQRLLEVRFRHPPPTRDLR